ILSIDPGVVRYRVAKVRLTVVVATGPHQVEGVGAGERSREPHDAGVVLSRCLEGSGEGIPDVGLVRWPPGHDVEAVVDALSLVADRDEQLIAPDRAAQVEAELGPAAVWDGEAGVRSQAFPLGQGARPEARGLAIATDGSVEFVA